MMNIDDGFDKGYEDLYLNKFKLYLGSCSRYMMNLSLAKCEPVGYDKYYKELSKILFNKKEKRKMESKDVYNTSYNELVNIRKNLTMDKITIDFDKLDGNSRAAIREAILNATSSRQSAILNVIGNANSGV